jgi:hypothetical protein
MTAKVQEQRQALTLWSVHYQMVRAHIVNGAARGLYPPVVAAMALEHLESKGEVELGRLMEVAGADA